MTYSNLVRFPVLSTPLLAVALALAGCDGDLGKDSAGGDAGSGTGSASSGADSGGAESGGDSASSAGTGGASSDSGGGGCDPSDCGPAPGADPMCPDGSSAQWSCVDNGMGCGWQSECPGDVPCTDEECGPAPGAPNELCPDGVNYSGPGPCERAPDGTCGWTWVECPACCDPASVPDCVEPITCCGDGSWVCGDAAACPDGTTALACDDGGGTGGQCVDELGSCADGQSCCPGLNCCAGVPVPPGQEYCGLECPISDRNAKENFASVDVHQVLDEVSQLQIMTWNYRTSPDEIRHLGPMAQDFKAKFDVGSTDKAIFQVDADGVALAAIQALHQEVTSLREDKAQLQVQLDALSRRLEALEVTGK